MKPFFFVPRGCAAAVYASVGFHEIVVDVLNIWYSTTAGDEKSSVFTRIVCYLPEAREKAGKTQLVCSAV